MDALIEAPASSPPRAGGWWAPHRLRSSLPVAGAAALATVLVMATTTSDPARWPSEGRFLCWMAVFLLSLWGWGTLAVRALGVPSIRGFVRVSLGIVALLAVGGFLLAAHLLSFPVLEALVIAGAGAQLWSLFAAAPALQRADGGLRRRLALNKLSLGDIAYGLAAAVVLTVACLRLIGSAKAIVPWWDADDSPAYWAFIRELTERGSFDQAFSFRRMVAYGGQTVLQALTCLGVPIRSANVFDAGLCPLLLVGVLLQVGRRQWLAIAAALFISFLPTSALNSASNFSGSLLLVVVYFALRVASDESPRRGGLLTGVAVAALCTLRHSYIPECGALLVAAMLAHAAAPEHQSWRERGVFFWMTALAFAATIAPWCLASLMASHTLLFPVWHGTYQGGGVDLGANSAKWLSGLKGILSESPPAPHLLVVFAAILALGSRLSRAALIPVALGTMAATFLLARTAPFNPTDDVRYLAAPWIGLAIAFYCESALRARCDEPPGRERQFVVIVATILVALQLSSSLSSGLGTVIENDVVRRTWPKWTGERAARAAALSLQARVPPGRTVLAACDKAYLFDFHRNKIVLIDLPTVASPFKLPAENATRAEYEQTIAAFEKRGIDYLMFSDPALSRTMYSAPRWESFRNDGYRTHELLVPRFAAWFGFERYVAAHRKIIAAVGNEKVASLR